MRNHVAYFHISKGFLFTNNAVQHRSEEMATHPLTDERCVYIIILGWIASVLMEQIFQSFPHRMLWFSLQKNLGAHQLGSSWVKENKIFERGLR